jgi:hypothetical protein
MSIRHNRDLRYKKARGRLVKRMKSFKTEEAAKAYADKNGIKNYTLKNLKYPEAKEKKFKIIISE